jgi:hypothetical protein
MLSTTAEILAPMLSTNRNTVQGGIERKRAKEQNADLPVVPKGSLGSFRDGMQSMALRVSFQRITQLYCETIAVPHDPFSHLNVNLGTCTGPAGTRRPRPAVAQGGESAKRGRAVGDHVCYAQGDKGSVPVYTRCVATLYPLPRGLVPLCV